MGVPWCWRRGHKTSAVSFGRQCSTRKRDLGSSYVEHQLTLAELKDIYADSYIDADQPEQSDGLSLREAEKRLRDGGPNVVQKPQRHSGFHLILNQHFYKFWLLLLGAAVLSIISFVIRQVQNKEDAALNPITAFILIPAVLLLSALSIYQERRTMRVLSATESVVGPHAFVIRDCQTRCVPVAELVVGDLLHMTAGQRIPADVRVLQANGLRIDSSLITGVSEPVEFTYERAAKHVSVFDSLNTAFQSTYVAEGDGIGLIIRTGRFTFLGNMADITLQNDSESLMRHDIKSAVDRISSIALIMAFVFFVIGYAVNGFQNVLFYFVVGFLVIVVASVPQGLPAAIMSHLAITAKRLARRSIHVRNMDVIDELGAATVLITNTAGILTENRLTVTDVWFNRTNTNVPLAKDAIKQLRRRLRNEETSSATFKLLLAVMGVCNTMCKWRERPSFSVRRARAASLAVALQQRAMSIPRTKLFTVVEPTTGKEKVRSAKPESARAVRFKEDVANVKELDLEDLEEMQRSEAGTKELKPMCSSDMTSNDIAIYNLLKRMGCSVNEIGDTFKPVYEIPYNSIRRWQLIVCRCEKPVDCALYPAEGVQPDQYVHIVMMKGAPEVILERCSQYLTDDGVHDLGPVFHKDCVTTWEAFSRKGGRILAFGVKFFVAAAAARLSAAQRTVPQTHLAFLGMCALTDPPRLESGPAVRQCKAAGLRLHMVTGDNPVSAMALACRVGLVAERVERLQMPVSTPDAQPAPVHGPDWALVHGKTLEELDDAAWDRLLQKPFIVFARTTPEQSALIVEACQSRGEIVAFTGGCVNDAPALAQANIGISPQSFSTDIARKAADVILSKNSFASITHGIAEARVLFDNMQLSVAYTFAHLFPEVFPIILNFTLGLPLALSPLQILSIDMACELPPAISLAYEKPERDIMKCKPRDPKKSLVDLPLFLYSYVCVGSIIAAASLCSYFSVYYWHGLPPGALLFSHTDFWHGDAANLSVPLNARVFSASEQLQIRGEAAAAYQITLVMSQVFHLIMCTTRRASVFRHGVPSGAVVLAVLIELLFLGLLIYVPFVRAVLGVSVPPPFVWAFGPVAGLVLLVFTEVRKFLIRRRKGEHSGWLRFVEF